MHSFDFKELLLSSNGGNTPALALRNMGMKFIDETSTPQFNYTGSKGKRQFNAFKNVCDAISGTTILVKQYQISAHRFLNSFKYVIFNYVLICISVGLQNTFQPAYTDTQVAEYIASWLT